MLQKIRRLRMPKGIGKWFERDLNRSTASNSTPSRTLYKEEPDTDTEHLLFHILNTPYQYGTIKGRI
jgi:hypothetical protein